MILVDYHEMRGFKIDNQKYIIPELIQKCGMKSNILHLEVGDYIIIGPSRSVCVGSKTADDFLGSISSGHLSDELYQMSANYDKNVLAVHGSIEQALIHRGMTRQSYFNYLAGCVIHESDVGKQGSISVVNFNSVWDFVQMLKSLHDITVSDNIFREPTAKKFKLTLEKEKEFSIQYMLKPARIGPKRSVLLKNKFGTLRNLTNATKEQLMEIPGIGLKTAKVIYEHVNK